MKIKHLPNKILFGNLIIILLVFSGFWAWTNLQKRKSPAPLPVINTVKNFALTERSNQPFSLENLHGKVWIADFIFTRCAGPCPVMTANMSQLQTALAQYEDVRLVSISVDPENDTPDVLAEYANRFDADPKRWFFLTGNKDTIFDITKSSFKLSVKEAAEDAPIIHSTLFVLIDRQGRIRGYYNSAYPEELGQLTLDVHTLVEQEDTL